MGNDRIDPKDSEGMWRDMVTKEITRLKETLAWTRAQKDAQNIELGKALNRADTCSSLLATTKDQRETLRSGLFRATERLAAKQEKMDADQERYLTDMTREQAEVKALCRKVEKEQTEVQALRRHIAARRADIVREAERQENQPALRVSDAAKKRRELVEERDRLKEELTWAVTQKNTLRAELHRAMEERDGTESYRVQAVKARDQERAEKTAAETRNRGLTIEVDRVMVEKANLIKTNGRLKRELETMHRLNKGLVTSTNKTSAVLTKVRAERNEARDKLEDMTAERDKLLDRLDDAALLEDRVNRVMDTLRDVEVERDDLIERASTDLEAHMLMKTELMHLGDYRDKLLDTIEANDPSWDRASLKRTRARLDRAFHKIGRLEKENEHLAHQLESAAPVVGLANDATDQARAERDKARGDAQATHEQVERLTCQLATARDNRKDLVDDYHKIRGERNQLKKDYQRMMRHARSKLIGKNDGE